MGEWYQKHLNVGIEKAKNKDELYQYLYKRKKELFDRFKKMSENNAPDDELEEVLEDMIYVNSKIRDLL